LGAPAVLFACSRRIFGHFFCSSLPIASYWRLIRIKTISKSASVIIANPNEKSGLKDLISSNDILQFHFTQGAGEINDVFSE
jgi:hypothetical protein